MRPLTTALRAGAVAVFFVVVAASGAGLVVPPQKPQQIHGTGCVEPGVETRCLVVKDVRSEVMYELFIKGVQPEMGSGIEFVGVPHHGATTCTQGTAVDVQTWAHRDLKCTQGTAPQPRK